MRQRTTGASRITSHVRSTIYDLRSTMYDLRSTIYDLRLARQEKSIMEKGSGSKTLLYVVLLLVVAFVAYGAGFVTPYATGQAKLGNTPAPGSTQQPGTGQSDLQEPTLPADATNIDKQFASFWSTFKAANQEFYYTPV